MKRTHDQVSNGTNEPSDAIAAGSNGKERTIIGTDKKKEEDSSESSSRDNPHPDLHLVDLNVTKTYILLQYFSDRGGSAASSSALLEIESLEPKRLKTLLKDLKNNENLAKYVAHWVHDPDECEEVDFITNRHLLCGNWTEPPTHNSEKDGPIRLAYVVTIEGDA